MNYEMELVDSTTWKLVNTETNETKILHSFDEDIYVMDENRVMHVCDENELDRVLTGAAPQTDPDREYYVGGFVVDQVVPYSAKIFEVSDTCKLPVYTKRKNSDIYYCAGYFCFKYEGTWKYGAGIMLKTLLDTEFHGPYHTKEKAVEVLSVIKQKKGK